MANPLKILTALSASSGVAINSGGLTINNNTGLVVNSNGITVTSGGASITGDLIAGATGGSGLLISKVGTELSGTTTTSGSLAVGGGGSLTVGGVTVATVNDVTGALGSYATQAQVTGALGSYATQAQVTGALGSYATAANVSSSFVSKDGSGNVIIGGNLTVQGTTTAIDSTTVNIGDKNINLATGSADLTTALNGGGIDLGSGSVVQWRYNHGSTAWKSNVDIDVAVDKAYKVNGTTILGSGSLTPNFTGSYITDGNANFAGIGHLSQSQIGLDTEGAFFVDAQNAILQQSNNIILLGGTSTPGDVAVRLAAGNGGDIVIDAVAGAAAALELKADIIKVTYNGAGFGDYITDGNKLNLTGALEFLSGNLGGGGISGAEVTSSVQSAYRQVRVVAKGLITGSASPSNRVTFLLSGSSTTTENAAVNTIKGLYGMSDASASTLLQTKVKSLSFDVALYDGGTQSWVNDLVSVSITASQGGSGTDYYPKFIIDAPGASDQTEIRLIAINEDPDGFVV